ncbi:MAG: rhamnogalacturonan acetylesterase [Bacilli bacterium]
MNKIYLLGDSTCQTNGEDTYPQTGWGQLLQDYVTKDYKVINLAKNGRSTKSFIDEGLFEPCKKKIKKSDIVLIQFGHNDEKEDSERHTDPFTTYQDNLNYFIDIIVKKGGIPVLVSSIYRRQFISEHKLVKNTHGLYPLAMKKVAKKRKVIFIDMNKITYRWLQRIGDSKSKQYFMNFDSNIYSNYPEGKQDNTHLRYEGAQIICEFIVKNLKKTKLKKIIK